MKHMWTFIDKSIIFWSVIFKITKSSIQKQYNFSPSLPLSFSPSQLLLSLSLFLTACPEPPEDIDCGPHQIEVNGECECEEGYHWNEDKTRCIMDTTSHNFVWEIDTLGEYGSYLKDVAIIDENNVWIVGNIETDSMEYNAAHWDGSEWEILRIQPEPYLFGQYTAVYGFSNNNVWFGSSIIVKWNGSSFIPYGSNEGYPGGFYISSIWGTSSSNLYFVGDNGSIFYYDGVNFERMESGTDIQLRDIHGTPDGEHVFAVGWNDSGESIALELKNSQWQELYSGNSYYPNPESLYGRISCVSVFEETAYFATTVGLLKYNYDTDGFVLTAQDQSMFYQYHFVDIHVQYPNDIILFSRVFSTLHFNGSTWFEDNRYSIVQDTWAKGGDFRNNYVTMVGYCCGGNHAIIARGLKLWECGTK